ncbi:hypothetical protein FD754_020903, partial [Muntiacus muntjak]
KCAQYLLDINHSSPANEAHIDSQSLTQIPYSQLKLSFRVLQILDTQHCGAKTECQPMGVVEVVEVTTAPLSSHLFFMKHLIYFYIFNYMNDFIKGLSILLRGTVQEKLNWAFNLYDINKDGYITKEEMLDIMKAIYDMMGKCTYPVLKEDAPRQHVETFFQKMDKNKDGVVTIDEFIESCQKDENIMRSMQLFENVI